METTDQWLALLARYEPAVKSPRPPQTTGGSPVEIIERSLAGSDFDAFGARAFAADPVLLIVVNDPHRFTDSRSAIEAVCRRSLAGGRDLRFRLLVAAGSHTFDLSERSDHEDRILGARADRCVDRAWHDAHDAGPLRPAGGILVHPWLAQCRFALAIGSLEPHYFAGLTGAHKTLTVGLMSMRDLAENHEQALDPAAAPLTLEGNPVYEAIAARLAALEAEGRSFFAINETLADGRVAHCEAGGPIATLQAARDRLGRIYRSVLVRRADLVVSIVRPPLDRDLYQADKGIKNVETAVRDGGLIILDAPCSRGIGIERFFRLLQNASTHAQTMALIGSEGYRLGDHKAARLRALTDNRAVQIAAVAPGLEGKIPPETGISVVATREEAADWAAERLGAQAEVVIAEDSGNLVLQCEER